ncbi:MAG: VCBS repeat-containing protein [Candidatus Marinimicrobia bacterium]|nr:VCBS repeat-containing protein [Candidatus Neomarinimicrobiota bacterium]
MYIIISVLSQWIFAFTFHDDLIPITFNDESLDTPFLGGFNRPKIQWIDWDNDNDIDIFILDASGYLRYVENQGNSNIPEFHIITTAFQNIFCGGWFFIADFDFDGDRDLLTQNEADPNHISFYSYAGGDFYFMAILSSISGDLVSSSSVMTPTFSDIDNDGDLDFFTGNMTGTLTHYENVGFEGGIPQFEFITDSWQEIYIVGRARTDDRHGASAITFIDLDGDGDLDLSWGDYFQQSLYIIWNSGTPEIPEMVEVTNQYPPNDPIISAGQNMPTFADLDGDGDDDLFVTVLSGAFGNQMVNNFYYYKNNGSNSTPNFVYQTNNYFSMLDLYSNSSPELVDIDNDGDLDLFVANQYDLSESPWIGKIHFFRNTGSETNPIFEEEATSLLNENMGQMLSPEFGDLDGDGDMDLLVGEFNGFIQYFENISSGNSISFSFIENVGDIDLSGNSVPSLGDIDGDGDLDLLIGQLNGSLMFYQNVGTNSQYSFQMDSFADIQVESNSAPELIDLDGDDDLDLIVGSGNNGLLEFRNLGNASDFQLQQFPDTEYPIIGVNTKPAMGHLFDLDTLDFIMGVSTGGLYHLRNETCSLIGDLNADGGWNVLDIVTLANCVLAGNCSNIENGCAGDLNEDGGWNVLDIVTLANCVLAGNCGG